MVRNLYCGVNVGLYTAQIALQSAPKEIRMLTEGLFFVDGEGSPFGFRSDRCFRPRIGLEAFEATWVLRRPAPSGSLKVSRVLRSGEGDYAN